MLSFWLGPTCISICILRYKLLSCCDSCNFKRFYTFPIFVAKRGYKSRFLTSKAVSSFVSVCFDVHFDLYFTIQTTHLHCFLEFHVFFEIVRLHRKTRLKTSTRTCDCNGVSNFFAKEKRTLICVLRRKTRKQ